METNLKPGTGRASSSCHAENGMDSCYTVGLCVVVVCGSQTLKELSTGAHCLMWQSLLWKGRDYEKRSNTTVQDDTRANWGIRRITA